MLAAVRGLSGNLRGMALMFVAIIGHSISLGMVRQVSAELHTFEIIFLTTLTGLPVLLPWFVRHGLEPFRTTRLGLHLVRTAIAVFGLTAWFHAVAITPLATASALSFSAPIFATVLAVLVLGEKVGGARWFAVFLGVAGMLVILRPGFIALELGPFLAVTSALSYAVTLIIIKVLSRTDSSVTILAYVMVLFVPLTFVQALLVWRWPSPDAWMWLVGIGVIGTAAQLLLTQALKEAETSVVMPLFFFHLIWMSVIGFAFFGEIPSVFAWIGGVMIIASGTFIAYRESRAKKALPTTADGPG
jgi:drug/metabolite transporter (DMT)-like permease